MAVCIGDVRAKDDGIEKRIRRLLAFVKLELFSSVLDHAFEKSCSRTATRAIKYQNPFLPFPVVPSTFDHATFVDQGCGNLLSPQSSIRGNKPLDRVLETLTRMSSIQKPGGLRVSRILNGLASSRPTSLDQTLFERLW